MICPIPPLIQLPRWSENQHSKRADMEYQGCGIEAVELMCAVMGGVRSRQGDSKRPHIPPDDIDGEISTKKVYDT